MKLRILFPSLLTIVFAATTFAFGQGCTVNSKKDPHKYFVVLAAHRGTPPHHGGPAFAMLIKTGRNKAESQSFGLYYQADQRINGPVPEELSRQFLSGHLSDQD